MVPRLATQFITPIPATPIATTVQRESPWSSAAMLIDQDIIPQHSSHRPSILLPTYKHISPKTIVRLDPGNEWMVVILPVSKNTTDRGCKVLRMHCKKFQNIIKQTFLNIHRVDHPNFVSHWLSSHHHLPWDGQMAMEFPV
jgi:hypothetical protein